MTYLSRSVTTILAAAVLLVTVPLSAEAHEHRTVAGDQYELTIGFLEEPAFAGEKNGLSLEVVAVEGETPVLGLADTLEAEVIFGDQTMALELAPVFQADGAYQAVFFPTTPGDYTFRVFGEINGEAIDESFTSSPEGFDSVQDIAPLQFPKAT